MDRVGIHNRDLTGTRRIDILRLQIDKYILARSVNAVQRNGYITEHLDTVLDADRGVELVLAVPLGVLLVALNLSKWAALIDREDCKVVTLRECQRHHVADKLFVCVVNQRSWPTDAEARIGVDVLWLMLHHVTNLLKALLRILDVYLNTVLGTIRSRGDVVHSTLTTLAERSIFDIYMLKVSRR